MALVKQKWLLTLVAGVLLFILTDQTLRFTGNVNYFPTLLVIGASVVPVSFVVYFLGQEEKVDVHSQSIIPTLLLCALLGGLLGILLAGVLEYTTLTTDSILAVTWVGPIEEFSKLVVPIALFILVRKRFNSELDGLLFGVAAGMSFAALETMGYGLITLVSSGGDIDAFDEILLIRGLLSPAGHAAWTGLIAAVLWRERARTGKDFNPIVIGIFLLAAALHSAWDIVSSLDNGAAVLIGYVLIGGGSLALLFQRLIEAKRYETSLALASSTIPKDPEQ